MQVRAPGIKTTRAISVVTGSAVAKMNGDPDIVQRKKDAGHRRRGRPAGSANIHTIELRAAIQEAFAKLGGAKYLEQLGHAKPETFCALLARTLPTQHVGAGGGPIEVVEVKSF
jgi:hypothetical protein